MNRFESAAKPSSERERDVLGHSPDQLLRFGLMTDGWRDSTHERTDSHVLVAILSEFHALLLGVAGHDLRQPVRVIQSTDEWLSGMLDADAHKVRLQLGEPAVARLTEQLDRLAGALRLYERATTMELSPAPLAPFDSVRTEGIDPVRQKGLDPRIRPTRAAVMSNAVLLDGIVRNLVRNAVKYAGGCFRKLWRRPRPA